MKILEKKFTIIKEEDNTDEINTPLVFTINDYNWGLEIIPNNIHNNEPKIVVEIFYEIKDKSRYNAFVLNINAEFSTLNNNIAINETFLYDLVYQSYMYFIEKYKEKIQINSILPEPFLMWSFKEIEPVLKSKVLGWYDGLKINN